jgi:hypothetical protein
MAIAITPALAYAFSVSKDVSPLEDGNFIIRVRLRAESESIYCLKLIDAEESVLDVYAPDGWCVATDGGTVVARSNSNPAKGNTVEFIIHSNLEDVSFTCSAFGRIDQIGKPINI